MLRDLDRPRVDSALAAELFTLYEHDLADLGGLLPQPRPAWTAQGTAPRR